MGFLFPKYIITCKDVSEHEDGSVTFHEVFESTVVEDLSEEVSFDLVLGLEYSLAEDENRSIKLRMLNPEKENIADEKFEIVLDPIETNGQHFSLFTISLDGFAPKTEGYFTIFVEHDDRTITRQDIYFKEAAG